MMIRSEAANIFPRRKGRNKVASVVRLLFDRYLLILLYIAFSVSIIQLFHSRFTLLVTTLSLLLILVLIRFRKIDKIIYYVVLYMIVIQLLAMIRFNELNTGRLLSLGLSVTRFMLSYLLIKLSGKYFFKWFEKISFVFIVAGLFIFFIVQLFPQVADTLSNFDIDSLEIQKDYGGWNIFIYIQSGWAGFRFSGYAWEPGGMAMMITISWMIYIFYYGPLINIRSLTYFVAMIFTFSTTGYFVLALFVLFYAANTRGRSFLILGIPLLLLLVFIFPSVWRQDFMKNKITTELDRDQGTRSFLDENEQYTVRQNIGRIGFISVSLNDAIKWPLGHGTVTSGRTKNIYGEILSGANGLMIFMVQWGFIGLIFLIYSLYLFIYRRNLANHVRFKILILLSLLLVFSSNQVSYSPVLYSIFLYPYIYK